ncbi:MAG TPA: hypothetical protein VKB50_28360, partial [Vicinamibacterales bacterium]|nr:hypothetical protein [Vicinamibacterales bacterium]
MTRYVFAGLTVAMLLQSGRIVAQGGATPSPSPNAVVPGELVIEPPTLINLGFEWFIQGDANRNAAVEVTFRKKGTPAW